MSLFQPHHCSIGYFSQTLLPSSFQALVGVRPAIGGIFSPFRQMDGTLVFPDYYFAKLQQIRDEKSIPYITWEPWDASQPNLNLLPAILDGTYDAFLDQWAQAFACLDCEILIRFGHEMNGNWYPWSDDPKLFREAFRYVVGRIRAVQTKPIYWMFSPNHDDGGSGRDYQDYFAGTDVVDCVGLSGYNFGPTQKWSHWMTFDELFLKTIPKLYQAYHLPCFLDIGCTEIGGDKSAWILDAFHKIATLDAYQCVRGIVWFNYLKETDWRIESSPESLSAFRTGAQQPYFS